MVLLPFALLSWLPLAVRAISGGFDAYGLEGAKGVVLLDNGFGDIEPPHCAGAILNSRIVLTNGLCCNLKYPRTVVHVCSTSPFERGPFLYLESFLHIGTSDNDHFRLCVLKLDADIEFTDECVPLALPTKESDVNNPEQLLHAFGYGSKQLDAPTDIEELNVLNSRWRRILSDDMQALEYPPVEDRHCNEFADRPHPGLYQLVCHGSVTNRTTRLMMDDNGAPVVGSKDNVVYSIMSTQWPLKKGLVWANTTFPMFGLDVFSARADILSAMGKLMNDKSSDPVD